MLTEVAVSYITVGVFGRVASGLNREVQPRSRFIVLIYWPIEVRKLRITSYWALKYRNMKAHMEEVEDDLAAEEENKLINEVRRVLMFYCLSITAQQSILSFQEYKTW